MGSIMVFVVLLIPSFLTTTLMVSLGYGPAATILVNAAVGAVLGYISAKAGI